MSDELCIDCLLLCVGVRVCACACVCFERERVEMWREDLPRRMYLS